MGTLLGTLSLTGADTIYFGTRLITDFSAGEVAKLTYANDLATVKTGKNGNTIYAYNSSSSQSSLDIKVIKGSDDDSVLQGRVQAYKYDPVGYKVDEVSITKSYGDGGKKVTNEKFQLQAGIPTKQVDATVNVDGDTDQAIAVYTWTFANTVRSQAIAVTNETPVVP